MARLLRDQRNQKVLLKENSSKTEPLLTFFGDKLDEWPVTIEQFTRTIYPLGVIRSFNDKKGVRKRRVAWQMEGRKTLPNLLAPVPYGKTATYPGTMMYAGPDANVRLVVRSYDTAFRGRVGLSGKLEASATPGKFLQVKFGWEWGCRSPIHCTKLGEPQRGDLDFIDSMVIEQDIYGPDNYGPEGLINFRKEPLKQKSILQVDLYQGGMAYELGTVHRVDKNPNTDDIELALRSFDGWERLKQYSTMELDFKGNGGWQAIH
jgi:hypothetical protein